MDPRFAGIARIFGNSALARLSRAHVCVVGLGGVGSWAVEALVRSGVSKLTLVDLDEVCQSNTNRQIQAVRENIGKLKTHVLRDRCLSINPDAEIRCIDRFYTAETAPLIFDTHYDFVVDTVDTSTHKVHLLANLRRQKQAFVTVGTAGGRTDPTKIRVSDLASCENDPLLALVRKRLRQNYGFSRNPKRRFRIPVVWSTEPTVYQHGDDDIRLDKPAMSSRANRLDCAGAIGSLTYVTGAFGFLAARYAVERIIKLPSTEEEE